jgi:RimJ/RimL family protein N-acetyltransferase
VPDLAHESEKTDLAGHRCRSRGPQTDVGLLYEGSTPEEPHLHGGDFHCLLAAQALNHPHAHHISPTSTKCRSVLVELTRLHGVIAVTLEPWGSGDLPLLERLMGDPHMTEHLGGPESPDKLRERQGRYERLESGDCMFKIVDVVSGVGVGSVGFWTKEWRDEQAYEIGWMVVPEFQGRGIAAAATAQAIELARRDDKHRFMHAFPDVDNAPSNAICRKLGFELLEACEFEFPKGHLMTCNDWRLDLRA